MREKKSITKVKKRAVRERSSPPPRFPPFDTTACPNGQAVCLDFKIALPVSAYVTAVNVTLPFE